jgi:hypothetical protein
MKKAADYLKQFAPEITRCEQNPFDLRIDIRAPLVVTLRDVHTRLQGL